MRAPALKFLLVFVVAAFAAESTAAANRYASDAFNIRSRLARWDVTPAPKLPAVIPGKIDCCSGELRRNGKTYTINYTALGDEEPGFIVSFSRMHKSWFRKMINFARKVQKHPVKPEKVGGKTMQFARTDITFWYLWKDQGYAYLLSSKYYGGVSKGQLRKMAASVGPVGSAYRGITSQGQPIEVYGDTSSPNGVFGGNTQLSLACGATGSQTFWTEAYDELGIDAAGLTSGSVDYSFYDDEAGEDVTVDASWNATFSGDTVSGSLLHATSAAGCSPASVSWTAQRVPKT